MYIFENIYLQCEIPHCNIYFVSIFAEVNHYFHGDVYDVKMALPDLSSTRCRLNIFWKIDTKNFTNETFLRYYVSYWPQNKPTEKVTVNMMSCVNRMSMC